MIRSSSNLSNCSIRSTLFTSKVSPRIRLVDSLRGHESGPLCRGFNIGRWRGGEVLRFGLVGNKSKKNYSTDENKPIGRGNDISGRDHQGSTNGGGRTRRSFIGIVSILVGSLSIGYILGSTYPIQNSNHQFLVNYLMNRVFRSSLFNQASHPTDREGGGTNHESDRLKIENLEKRLEDLEIVKDLRSRPEIWKEIRWLKDLETQVSGNKDFVSHHLTLEALRGIGRFAILPLVFTNHDETEGVVIVHVGDSMCGFDGILHGGLSATICDEGLAALAFQNLPSKVGVTASLKLNYRRPILAGKFLVLKSKLIKKLGRKVFLEGTIEDLGGEKMVEAEALFIEPRHAKLLKHTLF